MIYEQYTIGGELMHSAKGTEWAHAKYIDKVKTKNGKWRYIYKDGVHSSKPLKKPEVKSVSSMMQDYTQKKERQKVIDREAEKVASRLQNILMSNGYSKFSDKYLSDGALVSFINEYWSPSKDEDPEIINTLTEDELKRMTNIIRNKLKSYESYSARSMMGG